MEIASINVATLLQLAPSLWLFLVVFKNRFRFPYAVINMMAVSLCAVTVLSIWAFLEFDPAGGWAMPYSTVFLIILVVLCLTMTKSSPYQVLFTLFIIQSYADVFSLFSRLISDSVFYGFWPGINYALVPARVLVLLITYPFIWLFMTRMLKPMVETRSHEPFWKYFWLVPASFHGIYQIAISPMSRLDQNVIVDQSAIFLAVTWAAGTFLTYYIILHMLYETKENAELQEKLHLSAVQISMQKDQYEKLQEQIESTQRIRHDMRHHLLAMKGYQDKRDFEKLDFYLNDLLSSFQCDERVYCENDAVDAIVRYYLGKAKYERVDVETEIRLPSVLSMPETDFCVVLGNLLENAVEACSRQKAEPRFLKLSAQISGKQMIAVTVKNSYEGEIQTLGESFLSSKESKREGIGVASVRAVAEKYHGIAKFTYQDGVFQASVLLNP